MRRPFQAVHMKQNLSPSPALKLSKRLPCGPHTPTSHTTRPLTSDPVLSQRPRPAQPCYTSAQVHGINDWGKRAVRLATLIQTPRNWVQGGNIIN